MRLAIPESRKPGGGPQAGQGKGPAGWRTAPGEDASLGHYAYLKLFGSDFPSGPRRTILGQHSDLWGDKWYQPDKLHSSDQKNKIPLGPELFGQKIRNIGQSQILEHPSETRGSSSVDIKNP